MRLFFDFSQYTKTIIIICKANLIPKVERSWTVEPKVLNTQAAQSCRTAINAAKVKVKLKISLTQITAEVKKTWWGTRLQYAEYCTRSSTKRVWIDENLESHVLIKRKKIILYMSKPSDYYSTYIYSVDLRSELFQYISILRTQNCVKKVEFDKNS